MKRASVYVPARDPADHWLAHDLAVRAGRVLVGLRPKPADRHANEFLLTSLATQRPWDTVLSEESADNGDRLNARRLWIIDPLDGSREFAETGRTDWAVHVALWSDGALAAGAIALPALNQVYSTWQVTGIGAAPRRLTLLASRTRPPALVDRLARRLGGQVKPMGSAGAKTAALLQGAGSAYVHAGGQFEWDSAAPVAVALAHGLRVRRLDGSQPRYNRPYPALPDIVISRPSISDELWAALDAEESR
jgi:3'(2'), 5'-bisphosphate nucleotidase